MSALDEIIARDAAPQAAPNGQPSALDAIIARDAVQPVPAPAASSSTAGQPWRPLGGFMTGMADPVTGAAQGIVHGMSWLADQIAPDSQFAKDARAALPQIQDTLNSHEQAYQAQRQAQGGSGFDAARAAGNVVSPVTLGLSMALPGVAADAGLGGLAAAGARMGTAGGLTQPVLGDGAQFGGHKLQQALIGGATGGVLTPVISKVTAPITSRIATAIGNRLGGGAPAAPTAGATPGAAQAGPQVAGQAAGQAAASPVDAAIEQGAQATGRTAADLPSDQLTSLRGTVSTALQNGQSVDPAALLRKADFEDIEMPYTLGQITRDPAQFATERNLRGVAGVGESLLNRFNTQNQLLQSRVASLGGNQALEPYQAGQMLTGSLANIDNTMRQAVTDAYATARASSGKNLDVPLTGVAQDYAQVLNDFGDKVPSGVRNNFNQLGLMGGTQQKTFSIEGAENLLKVINSNQSNDPATNAALGTLRNSVKNAILSADDQGGVYAPARALAAKRFALQDAVPALEAASTGNVAPDDFVRRFIINGKTEEVQGLAKLLDPQSLQQARAQIGAKIQDAAFGQNAAGDKIFAPERYSKALNDLGTDKLGAFFSPQEIAQMHTLGRVGAYINSTPSAAAVNTSNTSGAILSAVGNGALGLLHVLPGGGLAAGAISKGVQGVSNARAVGEAMAADIPQTPANPAAQNSLLGHLLTGGKYGFR